MKEKDIVVGKVYYTYIGSELEPVTVVGTAEPDRYDKRRRFLIKRHGESRILPKARTAAALRETADKFY